jgi:hypothetical protein
VPPTIALDSSNPKARHAYGLTSGGAIEHSRPPHSKRASLGDLISTSLTTSRHPRKRHSADDREAFQQELRRLPSPTADGRRFATRGLIAPPTQRAGLHQSPTDVFTQVQTHHCASPEACVQRTMGSGSWIHPSSEKCSDPLCELHFNERLQFDRRMLERSQL